MDLSPIDLLLKIAPFAEKIGQEAADEVGVARSLYAAMYRLNDAVQEGARCGPQFEAVSALFLKWLARDVLFRVERGLDDLTVGEIDEIREQN